MNPSQYNYDIDNLYELPVSFPERYRRSSEELDILIIGDSWFNYPMKIKDINCYLSLHYNVHNISINDRKKHNEEIEIDLLEDIMRKISSLPSFKIVVLSMGVFNAVLSSIKKGKFRGSYYSSKVKKLGIPNGKNLIDFGKELKMLKSKSIIVHGYDYFKIVPKAQGESWLSEFLVRQGVSGYERQQQNLNHAVDHFNGLLYDFSLVSPKISYLDLRGTLNENDWYDELHPNSEGSRKLAEKIQKRIESLLLNHH